MKQNTGEKLRLKQKTDGKCASDCPRHLTREKTRVKQKTSEKFASDGPRHLMSGKSLKTKEGQKKQKPSVEPGRNEF